MGHFLVEEYLIQNGKKNEGKRLMADQCVAYLRTFAHMCRDYIEEAKGRLTREEDIFFQGLDPNCTGSIRTWWKRLQHNMNYSSFKHHVEAGQCVRVLVGTFCMPVPSVSVSRACNSA